MGGKGRTSGRAVAACMIVLFGGLSLVSVPTAAEATQEFVLTRLAGDTRVETAVEISKETFSTTTVAIV